MKAEGSRSSFVTCFHIKTCRIFIELSIARARAALRKGQLRYPSKFREWEGRVGVTHGETRDVDLVEREICKM